MGTNVPHREAVRPKRIYRKGCEQMTDERAKSLIEILEHIDDQQNRVLIFQQAIQLEGPVPSKYGQRFRALVSGEAGEDFPVEERFACCPHCGKMISEDDDGCRYCGESRDPSEAFWRPGDRYHIIPRRYIKVGHVTKRFTYGNVMSKEGEHRIYEMIAVEIAKALVDAGVIEFETREDRQKGEFVFHGYVRALDPKFEFYPELKESS